MEKEYLLNMPQLLLGGLSENWLLKELGDIHWSMISKSLNAGSDSIVDSNGERLYASFVRLQWVSSDSLFAFKESEGIAITGALSMYGNKMFFSNDKVTGGDKIITASLMSVFSSRESGDNKKLVKGKPLHAEKSKLEKHEKLPSFAKGYFDTKSVLFSDGMGASATSTHTFCEEGFVLKKEPLFVMHYDIDPYDDINGVGLLYFASYPKISDKCERCYFEHEAGTGVFSGNWAENAYCIARDIHYYGNANAGERVLYHLEVFELISDNRIKLVSSLYREKDGQLIAKIFTIKEVLKTMIALDGIANNERQEGTLQKGMREGVEGPKYNGGMASETINEVSECGEKELDKSALNDILKDYFNSMFDCENIKPDTSLRQIGVESIAFIELSEYLNITHGFSSNPSKLFGLPSIESISSHLLGLGHVDKQGLPNKKSFEGDTNEGAGLDDIAIIGMSLRVPGADNKQGFWKILLDNASTVSTIPKDRLKWPVWKQMDFNDKALEFGGYMDGIDKFDAGFFGIGAYEAKLMDPQQRIVLESVYTALEDASIPPSSLSGSDTGIFVGVSGSDYLDLIRAGNINKASAYGTIGTSHAILANRISYLLGLHGPSKAIDTACSSSLSALHEAVSSLRNRECGIVIAGGVNAILNPELTMSYAEAGMLSEGGSCKTFDEGANGYVRGEGAGIVVMKRLRDAERDGDHIYGVVKGSCVNHGGKANTLTSPNATAQKELLAKAYASAKTHPLHISYIEAHGTGTPLGDPIEIEGIKAAFEAMYSIHGTKPPKEKYCGVGSVKTNIGHLEAAAGIIGVIKVLLCIQHKTLCGNGNLKKQNKYIDLEGSPLYLRKESSGWEVSHGDRRIAGVSSFGFGGSNAHVVIAEYTKQDQKAIQANKPVAILLSAKNKVQLKEKVVQLASNLRGRGHCNVHDLAYTLQVGRDHMEERLAFLAENKEGVIQVLTSFQQGVAPEVFIGSTVGFEQRPEGIKQNLSAYIKKQDLEAILKRWVEGAEIDWRLLYHGIDNGPKKTPLPTYPFARDSYWLEDGANKQLDGDVEKSAGLEGAVSNFLTKRISELVSIEQEQLDKDEFISDYGMDSIQINHLVRTINTFFELDIRPVELYAYLTINEIAGFIEEKLAEREKNAVKPAQNVVSVKEGGRMPIKDNIAIVGLDLEIAGADTLEGLKALLDSGAYDVSAFPKDRWDSLPCHFTKGLSRKDFKGKFLDKALAFDNNLFKVSIREAMLMDPQQRLLLHSVWRAIENAGYTKAEFSKRKTSVFVAINSVDYADIVKYDDRIDEFSGRGVKRYISANRLSHFFNLAGESESIDTACSSFFVGIKKAIDALRKGICEQAIITGVQLNLLPFVFQEQSAQGILTSGVRTLPFDESAEGYVRSEGVGTIILKKEALALQAHDNVYALFRGAGIAHGGRSISVTSPNVASHKQAFLQALEDSGVNVDEIMAIETHGTGMPLGDESEIQAFDEVFKEKGRKEQAEKCLIGAAKSMIGHLEAASGALAVVKSVIALDDGKVHGIRGLGKPNPKCSSALFSISNEDHELPNDKNASGIVGLHSYGIGGVSSFLFLQKVEQKKPLEYKGELEKIFVLSAQSAFVLNQYVKRIYQYLTENAENSRFSFDHFLASYQVHREVMKVRLAVVASTVNDLIAALKDFKHSHRQVQVFGSPELGLPDKKVEPSGLGQLAHQWVESGVLVPKPDLVPRTPYPCYPMDKRKTFWVSQKKKAKPMIETQAMPTGKREFLMLDV